MSDNIIIFRAAKSCPALLTFSMMHSSLTFFVSGQAQQGFNFLPSGPTGWSAVLSFSGIFNCIFISTRALSAIRIKQLTGFSLLPGSVEVDNFEKYFYSNEINYDLLQFGPVFVLNVTIDHLHDLQAVTEFLIGHLRSFPNGEVVARPEKQNLQVLPVPVEVRGVEVVRGEVQHVPQGQQIPRLLQDKILLRSFRVVPPQVIGNEGNAVDDVFKVDLPRPEFDAV